MILEKVFFIEIPQLSDGNYLLSRLKPFFCDKKYPQVRELEGNSK